MRVLVWQDHGQISVISANLHIIVEKVISQLRYNYSETDIKYVSSYNSEFDFEKRVKFTTQDDECFEMFEFVNIEEI